MAEQSIPACGIYRTLADVGEIPAGRLVYYHNHGDPGAGVFQPTAWQGNRASFDGTGQLLPTGDAARYLEPLAAEGFYRVEQQFYCCDKNCQSFVTHQLVQLGYDEAANPILFVPEWRDGAMRIAEAGVPLDPTRLAMMSPLRVAEQQTPH